MNPRSISLLLIACLATALLIACAPSTPISRDDSRLDDGSEIARQLERDGDFQAAAEAWLALAETRPEEASSLRIRAAEAWLKAGQANQARQLLAATVDGLDSADLDQAWSVRRDLAAAELALLDNDLDQAGWLLAASADQVSGLMAERHRQLEARLAEARANPARAAFAELETSIYSGEFAPDLALALLIDFPRASLAQLQTEHSHRPELAPWLDLLVTARSALLDPPRLDLLLEDWESRHPAVGYSASEAATWLAAWRQTRPMARRVMIALPAREAMQRASSALRNGLVSAWLALPPDERPELIFRDVPDQADGILGIWFEAREIGAEFLIGPLEREQVDRLLELPDVGLPTLLLNHPSDRQALNRISGPIQAIGLIPEEEAELAAVQALVLGHRRALVLAQSGEWGQRVAEAFITTFELGGGRVVDRAEYAAGQTDHSALMEVFLKLDQSKSRARRLAAVIALPIEAQAQPRTDLDLIFLAARAADARILVPQLDFFGVGDVPVMGTSQLVQGAPQPGRDGDIDGSLMPLPPWFIDSSHFGVMRLAAERRFDGLGNPTLSMLHALGADAFELARWADQLQADPELYLAGRTGRLRLGRDRLIERDLPLVRIRDGRAERVE